MQEEPTTETNLAEPDPAASEPSRSRPLLAVALGSFALGAVVVGLIAWTAGPSLARLIGKEPEAAASPAVAVPVPVANPTLAQSGFDQRIAALEQRLARIDLQATAASGNAARAEGLLIAFAARRMVDKGAPLGFLEEQLRVRFADAQPNAVATVIAASARPITLDQLIARLQAMAPTLTEAPPEESGWEWLKREVSNLFVIRRDSDPSPSARARIDRALLYTREGKIEEAVAEVQRLSSGEQAANWINAARRYQSVHQALDLIETTALLEPRRLNDGSGRKVDLPSPAAGPAAEPPPTN
jgi:hypothetical protein